METSERIRLLRIGKLMTQKQMGEKLGVSEVSIRNWENGIKNPSMQAIVDIASLFGVSTDYLLGVVSDKNKDEFLLDLREKRLIENFRRLDGIGRKAVESVCSIESQRTMFNFKPKGAVKFDESFESYDRIPLYMIPSAAGYSVPMDEDDFEMIDVTDDTPHGADFAVRISGRSMHPFIRDGEIVYVKKDCEMHNGDVGIFSVDGAVYCKLYYKDALGNLTLVSANPKMKNANVSVEPGSEVRCYGKVLTGETIPMPDYFFM